MTQVAPKGGYEPEADRLRRNLRSVIDKISAHMSLNQRSYMVVHMRTQGPSCAYNTIAKRMDAEKYDQWMQFLSDTWPDADGLEWPTDVPRPPRSDRAKEVA